MTKAEQMKMKMVHQSQNNPMPMNDHSYDAHHDSQPQMVVQMESPKRNIAQKIEYEPAMY